MEGEGSPSNREDRPVSPEVAETAAASSSASSSSESSMISGLDGSVSSQRVIALHPPQIGMKVVIRIVEVMSK
jgi:hypothetical protein